MAAANVPHERMPGTDRLRGAQACEPAHGSEPGFQLAVIGLDPVVRPPGIDMVGGGQQLVEDPRVGGGLVGGHLDRAAAVRQGPGEEAAGCGQITLVGGEHVDDLPVLVDRPVQIDPPAGNLHIRLVDKPPIPGNVALLLDQWISDR